MLKVSSMCRRGGGLEGRRGVVERVGEGKGDDAYSRPPVGFETTRPTRIREEKGVALPAIHYSSSKETLDDHVEPLRKV